MTKNIGSIEREKLLTKNSSEIIFQKWKRNKNFSEKWKLMKSMVNKSTLQEMLKVLQWERKLYRSERVLHKERNSVSEGING